MELTERTTPEPHPPTATPSVTDATRGVSVELIEDRTHAVPSDGGFIKVRRYTLATRYRDGRASEPYAYDVVDRHALDAVLIVLTSNASADDAEPLVCIRTALRPPVALRATRALVVAEEPAAMLWELPAGLIEPSDARDPVRETASRECREETGYDVAAERFVRLGPPVFLSPGLCAEKLHFVHAWIDRDDRREVTATEVVEQASELCWISLSMALALAEDGVIQDCKTELALRRLREKLSSEPRTSIQDGEEVQR